VDLAGCPYRELKKACRRDRSRIDMMFSTGHAVRNVGVILARTYIHCAVNGYDSSRRGLPSHKNTEAHLRRSVSAYAAYFNHSRSRLTLFGIDTRPGRIRTRSRNSVIFDV
jgi:hypothetical protein